MSARIYAFEVFVEIAQIMYYILLNDHMALLGAVRTDCILTLALKKLISGPSLYCDYKSAQGCFSIDPKHIWIRRKNSINGKMAIDVSKPLERSYQKWGMVNIRQNLPI